MIILANFVDIHIDEIYPAEIVVEDGRIHSIQRTNKKVENYVLPGFIDAHIHIESSMVTPVAFSRTAVKHGTVGAVSDPHEIANVMGIDGVKYMIENARSSPLKIMFGAPSCVPATSFESSGAVIDSSQIRELFKLPEIGYLSEMMNYPGVIHADSEVMEKLQIAREGNFPIDGHAPGIRGKELKIYAGAGISTDHECFTYEEALEKISHGMKILIREGSGAKNYEALIPLLKEFPEMIMFCSDDLHPDDLLAGHINLLVKRTIDLGYDLFDTLRAANLNAINHYRLDIGSMKINDSADFIIVDSLKEWNVLYTYINGVKYFDKGEVLIKDVSVDSINTFNTPKITKSMLEIQALGKEINVIEAIDGELVTGKIRKKACIRDNKVVSDMTEDVLKIAVINRYTPAPPALGFIKGFGLKNGALASSIAHDSHNIVCVGTNDEVMAKTINWIIENRGGIAAHNGENAQGLALEVGGIMSASSVEIAAASYKKLTDTASLCGSKLKAPFMTLAFMALLVIPELKLSDKGLFDGLNFSFISLFAD